MGVVDAIDGLSPTDAQDKIDAEEKRLALGAEWDDWELWLAVMYPEYTVAPFAAHHELFWKWLWAIEKGKRPESFVGIWPRGGAKSSSAELGCVALGARGRRKYGIYVCEAQEQSDDHVSSIGALLESPRVANIYPAMGERLVSKYGHSKGWRRNRLRTASGFTVDAIGLDTAARGVKLEEQRPDFMVLDEIDGEHDTAVTTQRKIVTFTRKLVPAGAKDLAILAIQNLVHPNSVFSQLVDGRADFMGRRIVSGPIPAVEDLETETREGRVYITGGTATWEGQSLDTCQEMIDDMGISAFMSECQHKVEAPAGGMFSHLEYERITREQWNEMPWPKEVTVWVDPAVTNKDDSDCQGIQCDAIGYDGKIYRLYSWEGRSSPLEALKRALRVGFEHKANVLGVETDQGGDTWKSVYAEAVDAVLLENVDYLDLHVPRFAQRKAGEGYGGKTERAQRMLAAYERGKFVHVEGTHTMLERALHRFPKTKPYDLVDAAYWSAQHLEPGLLSGKRRMRIVA